MDEEADQSSGLTGNWNGRKLASEAEAEEIDFDKIVDVDADDEDEEDSDSEEFDVQLSPSDERLLEELLRLKLTSLPATSGSSQGGEEAINPAASVASLLPLSKNRGLFQPRSKLEQFEDIIFESQFLEAALPELEGKPMIKYWGDLFPNYVVATEFYLNAKAAAIMLRNLGTSTVCRNCSSFS